MKLRLILLGLLFGVTATLFNEARADEPGLKLQNVRVLSPDGERESVSQFHYQMTQENRVIGYNYWLDNDYESRKTVMDNSGTAEFSFGLSDISNDYHIINIQPIDSNHKRGLIYQYMFTTYMFSTPVIHKLKKYIYWIDDDVENAVAVEPGLDLSIPLEKVRTGLHRLSIRGVSDTGYMGPISENIIFNTLGEQINVTGYRYSINDYSTEVTLPEPSGLAEQYFIVPLPDREKFYDISNGIFSFTDKEASFDMPINSRLTMDFRNEYNQWFGNFVEDLDLKVNIVRDISDLNLYSSMQLPEIGDGSFECVRYLIKDNNPRWIRFSNPCKYRIFHDGKETGKGEITASGESVKSPDEKGLFQVIVYDQKSSENRVKLHLLGAENSAPTPLILRSGNDVTMSCADPDAIIRFTLDGTEPTADSPIYDSQLHLTKNLEIRASSFRDELEKSPSASLIVRDLQTIQPVIKFSDGKVTFLCDSPDASIYYCIGENNEMIPYSGGEISLSDNRPVYCYATSPDLNDSEKAVYSPDYFFSKAATAQYDGRYLSLSSSTAGATIRYTLDDTEPDGDSSLYAADEKIDAGMTGKLRMRVDAPYLKPALSEYPIDYYFDGERVMMTKEGNMEKAFEWVGKTSSINTLIVEGTTSDSDFEFMRKLTSMKRLDLSKAMPEKGLLPAEGLKGFPTLVEVSLPASATGSGERLLEDTPLLCALHWNSQSVIPEGVIDAVRNPNILIYAKQRGYVPSGIRNVIVDSEAVDGLTLIPGYPFDCPQSFTAKRVEITRDFTLESGLGESKGWETIALPFNADRFYHETVGECKPFANADNADAPFWLFSLSSSGWEEADRIEAYTPYIISMPNNDLYSDNYLLAGKVTIWGEDVEVPVTRPGNSSYSTRSFITSMMPLEADMNRFNLNDAENSGGYRPGSVFLPGLKDVKPMEAYMTTTSNERVINIFDDFTQVDLLPAFGNDGLLVQTFDNAIIISSMRDREVNLFDATGRLLKRIKLFAGEQQRIDSLQSGVYIVEGVKVII